MFMIGVFLLIRQTLPPAALPGAPRRGAGGGGENPSPTPSPEVVWFGIRKGCAPPVPPFVWQARRAGGAALDGFRLGGIRRSAGSDR